MSPEKIGAQTIDSEMDAEFDERFYRWLERNPDVKEDSKLTEHFRVNLKIFFGYGQQSTILSEYVENE